MGRYEIFFDILPAWAAVVAWMVTFILVSWLLQKIISPIGSWVDSRLVAK